MTASIPCRGFTVIELIAVIAVTSIVVGVAYSAWRTHTIRSQVAESAAAARHLQDDVVADFRVSGELPSTASDIGGIKRSAAVYPIASLFIENGRIDLVYGREADDAIVGRRLSLTPHETADGQIVWICGNRIPEPGLRPLGFAGGGRQAVQVATTIEARYLPRVCR